MKTLFQWEESCRWEPWPNSCLHRLPRLVRLINKADLLQWGHKFWLIPFMRKVFQGTILYDEVLGIKHLLWLCTLFENTITSWESHAPRIVCFELAQRPYQIWQNWKKLNLDTNQNNTVRAIYFLNFVIYFILFYFNLFYFILF